jgi:hypothetical protein
MSEQLLNIDQVAMRLGAVRRTIQRHLPKLKANGLQEVRYWRRRFIDLAVYVSPASFYKGDLKMSESVKHAKGKF